MIIYTPEQHDILDHAVDHDGTLLVSARPGTGKTFLAHRIAEALKPKSGLYTAFNKAIVECGVSLFAGLNVECKTMHALAYRYVRPKMDISDISYSCITEKMEYDEKLKLIEAINLFFVSASTDMYDFMDEHFKGVQNGKRLGTLATKYIQKMLDEEMNPTFNFMLKYFHLMLVEGTINCSYDLVIMDEINDVTAVVLEIFKLIKAPKKIGLGETNQAIYDFLNLVNGFEELKDVPILGLTQSFRCSIPIASKIQAFMRLDVNDDFKFTGTDEPVANGKYLYCTATNGKIIQEISERLHDNLGFALLRKIPEIFAYPMAISTAAQGREVFQKKYRYLETEYKEYEKTRKRGYSYMQHLLDKLTDQETKSAVNLILSLNRRGINLFNLYREAKAAEVDLDYTIATVFTSKGLEFETVYIADDLNRRIQSIREKGGIQDHEDLVAYRCYYVACSRAGCNLINATVL